MSVVRSTDDAYLGLEAPSPEAWDVWHRAMLDERDAELARAGLPPNPYDASTDWSDATFRQFFLFMYDASFYDRAEDRYRTRDLVERWSESFGRVDSVLLWQAYPRIGFDARTQFDFYRDMPGGLSRLRADVCDVFHEHGIRVFVDYNPWAEGGVDELGEIVRDLDADGVMLDTLAGAPDVLAREVARRRAGVVLAPELRPRVADLGGLRQSWAQWADVGDASTPSILKLRWLVPRHRQFAIRRWDVSRTLDIAYSFFNGSGLLLWDDVFGTWNPYSGEDRRLIAETAAILDAYRDAFVHGEWLPLVPTGVAGLDANRWEHGARAVVTLRNRTAAPLRYRVPEAPSGRAYVAFWGERRELRDGDAVSVPAHGVQALVLDEPAAAERAVARFDLFSRRAGAAIPGYDERAPLPRRVSAPRRPRAASARMIELPAGAFDMTIRHERRECGCVPDGASPDATWGWFYRDVVEHVVRASVGRFAMRATAVTNAEFVAFVHAAAYRPKDGARFLAHLAQPNGALPASVDGEMGRLPVTFVSLDDARAYAAFHGERLPTEAEWQWAAEDAGRGLRWPWGDEPKTFPARLRPADDADGATPRGIRGLSGNAWELTESEHADGHTRFVMLRGGVFLPTAESEWIVARGPRPNDFHAKYILMSDGLDRSETISFRTVVDLD